MTAKYVAILLCISPPDAAMCDHSYMVDKNEISLKECSEVAQKAMKSLTTSGIEIVCIRVK
jgi:hypothetical protein